MRDPNILGSNKTHGSLRLVFTGLFKLTSCKRAITLAAALVCSSLVATPTSGDKIKRTVPLSAAAWTVDLRRYGDTDPGNLGQLTRLRAFHTSDLFLTSGDLMATFETHNIMEGLQRRDDPHRTFPYSLHAIVFDAASGRILRQASWGSDYHSIGIVPRYDGGIGVFLGDHLDLYGADLAPRGEVKLLQLPDADNILHFSASPTGKTILIQYSNAEHSCVWIRDGKLPQTEEKCEAPLGSEVSDHEVSVITNPHVSSSEMGGAVEGGYDPDSEVRVKTFDGDWRTLCRGQQFHCGIPYFIAEDLLLLRGDEVVLIRNDGKTVFWAGRVHWWGPDIFSYAATPHLLAFATYERTSFTSVELSDAFEHKRLLQVKTEGNETIHRLEGLAISEDGRYLGMQSDGILRVFAVPQSNN